jgi:hypothetical protein
MLLLLQRDPGDAATFGVLFSIWDGTDPPVIMDPFAEHWAGVRTYRFYLGRFMASIKVDQRPFAALVAKAALSSEGPLHLISRKLAASKEIREVKHIIGANKQLKSGRTKRAICVLCLAIWLSTPALAEPDDTQSTPGRYQIVVNPQTRADTFLLDTATGRVWMVFKHADRVGEPTVWEEMGRLDNLKDYTEFRQAYPLKKAPTNR